jgi:hypothetical protein
MPFDRYFFVERRDGKGPSATLGMTGYLGVDPLMCIPALREPQRVMQVRLRALTPNQTRHAALTATAVHQIEP